MRYSFYCLDKPETLLCFDSESKECFTSKYTASNCTRITLHEFGFRLFHNGPAWLDLPKISERMERTLMTSLFFSDFIQMLDEVEREEVFLAIAKGEI